MNLELTAQGLILMAVGLAVVFTFLIILVLVMSLSSRLTVRYAHLLPDEAPASPRSADKRSQAGNGALVAAIVATLTAGRN